MIQILVLEYQSSVPLQASVYSLTYASCRTAISSRRCDWAICHHLYLWIPRRMVPTTAIFVVQSLCYVVCLLIILRHAWPDLFRIFESLFKRIIQTRSSKVSFQGLNKLLKAYAGQNLFPQLFLKF